MTILIAAATPSEIEITKQFLESSNFPINRHQPDILITGVGGISTTYSLTKSIQRKRPEYIIQAGIAGSFSTEIPLGTTVGVGEEIMGDLGAEENSEFKDVFDLGLMNENDPPFAAKILKNPFLTKDNSFGLPIVRGVTINEITTGQDRINLLQRKFNPHIESMEGAAFHYVCLSEKIPFIQIRAISNYVGERNKDNWRIALAIENLNRIVIDVLRSV